jgi:hypothetical protein
MKLHIDIDYTLSLFIIETSPAKRKLQQKPKLNIQARLNTARIYYFDKQSFDIQGTISNIISIIFSLNNYEHFFEYEL